MSRNNLADLNNHLFEMLEKLNDEDEMQDKEVMEREIAKAKAICQVSGQILDVARLQIAAIQTAESCNFLNKDMPALLAIKDSRRVIGNENE
ncbi:MAG: hypothetical protein J6S85_01620 [Methanobrevibacter sp.]|nr:hypothetical protein [Methanobrevibacter sp.]